MRVGQSTAERECSNHLRPLCLCNWLVAGTVQSQIYCIPKVMKAKYSVKRIILMIVVKEAGLKRRASSRDLQPGEACEKGQLLIIDN